MDYTIIRPREKEVIMTETQENFDSSEMKICSRGDCVHQGALQPVTNFDRSNKGKNGLCSYCKDCRRAAQSGRRAIEKREKKATKDCFPAPRPALKATQAKIDPKSGALDVQVGGDHYKRFAIQPIEFTTKNKLSFIQGCVIKRICRYNLPGGKGLQDLEKIKHEIDCLIDLEGLRNGKQ
jgi:hypothetical protein